MPQTEYDVVVIGAGAAGLMCAIEAGKRGRRVLVVERNDEAGRKILISGGGRCNFTNLYASAENYICRNPNFHKSALARYTPADFIALVEAHGIAYHERKLGQLFCDGSARQIVDMLLDECRAAGVEVRTSCQVESIARPQSFELATSDGVVICASLVVATGGLSIPKLGATAFGYEIARQFGLEIVPPRPGLVPLTFSGPEHEMFASLSGVSVPCAVTCDGQHFEENLLCTHHGLSGPAILQASNYAEPGEPLSIDLLPNAWDVSSEDLRTEARDFSSLLATRLPRRFAEAWSGLYAPSGQIRSLTRDQIESVTRRLRGWELRPAGTRGFAQAEVTVGGVDTDELSSRTMESRRVPGLYFIGEVVDVTGWLGGYNFQWAWASGFAAGQSV